MPGTPKVGYMGPESGPFCCSRCKHYKVRNDGSGCDQKEVVAELGKGKNGLAPVDPQGCCNEFEPRPYTSGGLGLHIINMAKGKKAS